MKKFEVTVMAEIVIKFDENDEKFQEMFNVYKELIDGDATYESLAKNIAYLVAKYGTKEQIEGVGHVNLNGVPQNYIVDNDYVPIEGVVNVECDTDINSAVDFYIDSVVQLK